MNKEKIKVEIYYSSKTEPEGLIFYEEGIEYLKDEGISIKVIDVSESGEKARENGIISTPTVVITKGEKKEKKHGVVSTLKGILEKEDIKRDIEEFKK